MNQKDLRTMPLLDEQYQNIKHPFTNYTVGDAVALTINHAKTFGKESGAKVPTSLREVRDYIEDLMKRAIHQWLMGFAALDVLDAVIDGKDITKECRFLLMEKTLLRNVDSCRPRRIGSGESTA